MQNKQTQMMRTLMCLSLTCPLFANGESFVGVGFLSASNPMSECSGVSDDGSIVSGTTLGPGPVGELQGFYWTQSAGMVSLGNPPLSVGSASGRAADISGDGLVLAGTTKFDGLGSIGFQYDGLTGFAALMPVVATSPAAAFATNGDGKVTVGETRYGGYVGSLTHSEATAWLDDGLAQGHGLGLFPGGSQSLARGVSRDGRVIVGEAARALEEGQTAFRWDAVNGFVSLGDLAGGYHFSRANAASSDGSIVVGYGTISFSTAGFNVDHRACYWDDHGVHELPNLAGSTGVTEATDISPDGRYIVGWARFQATNVPVIWDDVHGVRNLYEVMTLAGVDVSSWNTGMATAVSADGKTVVGYGQHASSGATEGWICTLP